MKFCIKSWQDPLAYVAGTANAVLQANGYEPDVEEMALMTLIFMEVLDKMRVWVFSATSCVSKKVVTQAFRRGS
ncbi:MAG: hypothetical protein ABJ310_00595 [Roseobacter sp.]